VERSVG